jgi:hypothetical protein
MERVEGTMLAVVGEGFSLKYCLGALSLTTGVIYIETQLIQQQHGEGGGNYAGGGGRGLRLEVLPGGLELNHRGHLHRDTINTKAASRGLRGPSWLWWERASA